MDVDGAGIFGGVPVETLRLSARAQPSSAFRSCAALLVSHQASVSFYQGEPARASLGVLDESGRFGNGGGVELAVRHQGVPAAPVGANNGCWLGRRVAVLRAASVRGSLLGT